MVKYLGRKKFHKLTRASRYNTTLGFSELFRTTRSFTQVCKRRLQGWVLDFMWKRTETPLKFKDEEVWPSTLVLIVCILKHTDGLKIGFSLDLDSTKPVSAALTIKPRCWHRGQHSCLGRSRKSERSTNQNRRWFADTCSSSRRQIYGTVTPSFFVTHAC